tara:strand:+ start:3645 stop:3815 length:171 start_codon:yes stop_codon:yes gene_type:complete
VIGVIADNEVIKIVTKKITSILSLNLSIKYPFLKRYGGINPSTISECQQNNRGEEC